MPLTIDDGTILAAINADILAAWSSVKIFNGPPQLSGTKADLPRAFVHLDQVSFDYAGGTAGMSQASVPHTFSIIGQFTWPASGTIEAVKTTRAQALLTRLSAAKLYAGYRYNLLGVEFNEPMISSAGANTQERIYEIMVQIAVEYISPV